MYLVYLNMTKYSFHFLALLVTPTLRGTLEKFVNFGRSKNNFVLQARGIREYVMLNSSKGLRLLVEQVNSWLFKLFFLFLLFMQSENFVISPVVMIIFSLARVSSNSHTQHTLAFIGWNAELLII